MYHAGKKSRHEDAYDGSVYAGVRKGMKAMKKMNVTGMKTEWLPVKRVDERIFSLPEKLNDAQSNAATVVLNGVVCKQGSDYAISNKTVNWVSQRKLRPTDGLAIRYSLDVIPSIKVKQKIKVPASAFGLRWTPSEDGVDICIPTRERKPEVDVSVWVRKDYEPEHDTHNCAPCHGGMIPAQAVDVYEEGEVEDVYEEEIETGEEEDMIPVEAGVKVWHRMTKEGPWIAIQRSTLKIRSSFAGGGLENTINESFVETAWTVQTEDQGMIDFPEVMLTTRPPRDEKKGMALWKKLFIGVGASGLAFGIVNAQWIATLLGYGIVAQ